MYKSRQDPSQQNEFPFGYEDLPIPTLSEECKQLGEGTISLEECIKVLNPFPLNKVREMMDCLLTFIKLFGEMSPSQREAVITLIEKKIKIVVTLKCYYDQKITFIFSLDFETMFVKHSPS